MTMKLENVIVRNFVDILEDPEECSTAHCPGVIFAQENVFGFHIAVGLQDGTKASKVKGSMAPVNDQEVHQALASTLTDRSLVQEVF